MIKHGEEFKREAVRIALTSGLPRERVASDLGVGKSTLNKWVSHYRPSDLVAAPQADLARENERLRLENRVLREVSMGTEVSPDVGAQNSRCWRHRWPVELMCRVLQVSERGYRSWRSRPISHRERTDMKVLAHIREQYSLSLGSYGRPRMTMELEEAGLDVGERRVGRLMRINGIKPVRTRKHKVTTDSHHRLGVAANWLDGDFAAHAPNRKWAGDITYVWTSEGWLYLAVILDLHSRRVVGWAVSDRMKKDLAIRALDMAVRLRQPLEGCIFHSDRGPVSNFVREVVFVHQTVNLSPKMMANWVLASNHSRGGRFHSSAA